MGAVVPQSLNTPQREAQLVAAEESVGRQLKLRCVIATEFVPGRLTEFCRETGMHKFTAHDGREEWVSLSNRAYQWMSPPSDARPNPTFVHFPGNHEAVGWKVRVYWNEMGRWYTGRVRAYDQTAALHKVQFFDGDVRWYSVRDEAVQWLEKKSSSCKMASSTNGSTDWMRNVTGTAPEGAETPETAHHHHQQHVRGEMTTPSRIGKQQQQNCKTQPQHHHQQHSSMATAASSLSVESSVQSGRQLSSCSARNVCRSTLPSGMKLRPRKNPSLEQLIEKNVNFCIVNCRIGVFWPSDNKYYRGTLKAYNEDTEKYRILYDDDQKEEIDLDKDVFRWLGPKAFAAGYTPLMKEVMIVFGSENVRTEKIKPPWENTASDIGQLSTPKDVIGQRLFLYWDATGDKYEAEVLAYDGRRKVHYLWFRDGELEWVDLRKEVFHWVETDSRFIKEFPSGLEEGIAIPRGKSAIGWRIAVYWSDDVQFYDGKITRYHGETGRHDVDYDDGTMETLSLSSEKIIWKASPLNGITATAVSLDSSQSCSQKAPSTRKPTRGAVSSPKTKRPRLPSSPSSDLAKENHAELLEVVDSNGDMTTTTTTTTTTKTAPPVSTAAEPTPPVGFFVELPHKRPPSDGRDGSVMEEEDEEEEVEETEEDFELYPVMDIPPEPLPAVQQTRLAKLPVRFGGGAFQVRILAAKPETAAVERPEMEQKCHVDQALACVNDYQSAMTRIGRMPSAMEVSAALKVLPDGPLTAEYPTKEMTGMETVTSRVGFPQQQQQQQQHRKALPNQGRGRKKSRSTPMLKSEEGGTQTTLDSVLATFAAPVPLPPVDLAQGLPSASAAAVDGASLRFDMDYSKDVFDVACHGKLPFVDLPSPTAFRLMQDNIGTAAAPGHSLLKKLDPSNGDDPA